MIRVIEDGDYVLVHHFNSKRALFDIFRFENGKIVEHWDTLQDIAAPNPSGHTMVDGATKITDLNKTEANKALVKKFAEDVLIGKNPGAMPSYFDGDNYIQHNPTVGDGLTKQGPISVYDKIHMVIGEGNFVLAVSEANFGGKP
jgi:predicted SnoaL-like aldol condensation-catalyzing enzyme